MISSLELNETLNDIEKIFSLKRVKKKIKVTAKKNQVKNKRKYISYKYIYKQQHKLVILVAILKLPKNRDRIKSITIQAEEKYNVPIAIQVTSKKGYDFIIYQNDNQIVVDSSLTNRPQSKVYNIKDAQKIIREIINL
ncbi:MAG: hypothetical protein KAG14_04200 [Mycoplasmataceae bacterium]|nr:hypothetical protein [Mycoplasmataceae bacterium]